MARILIFTPYYSPDLGPSAPMITMLSEDLVNAGEEVTVIAAVPHYPEGFVAPKYRHGIWQWSVENNVCICRTRIPGGNRGRLPHRLLVFGVFQILAALASLRVKHDLALVTNPALETFLPFLVEWIRGKPTIFAVWDIYPDAGIQLGVFRYFPTIKLVRLLEQFCLRRATHIQTLSENMARILRARVPKETSVQVIPIWLDAAQTPPPRHNFFSSQHSLDDSFVVMYSGNMGYSQGLEHILEVADILRNQSSIQFVFIGNGAQRDTLIEMSKQMELGNTRFLAFLPHEIFQYALASADIAIVSQNARVSASSLPSKTFTWMAAGKPIVAFAEKDSDLFNVLVGENAGECVDPFNAADFANRLLKLRADPTRCAQLGENGRACILRSHSRSMALEKFTNIIHQSANEHQY